MKEFDIYLRDRVTELDVAIRELTYRTDMSAFAKLMLLSASGIGALLEKFVKPLFDANLSTDGGDLLVTDDGDGIIASGEDMPAFYLASSRPLATKTAFCALSETLKLLGNPLSTIASKSAGSVRHAMRLEEGEIMLTEQWLYSCEPQTNRLLEPDVATRFDMCASVSPVLELKSTDGLNNWATKYLLSLCAPISLESKTGEAVLEYIVGAEDAVLSLEGNAPNAIITRYRLLGEMDSDAETSADLTLGTFDDMEIFDVDYVTLE